MSGTGLFNMGPSANGTGSNLQLPQQLQQQQQPQQQQQNTRQSRTPSTTATATIPDSPESPTPAKPVYVSSYTIDELTDEMLSEVLYSVCYSWCIETKRANIDGLLDTFSKVCKRWKSLVTRPKFVNQLTHRLIRADVSHRYYEKPSLTKQAFAIRRAFQAETAFTQLTAISDSHVFLLDKSMTAIHVFLMDSDVEWFYQKNRSLSLARYCQSRFVTGNGLTDNFKSFKWIQACSFNKSLYCGLVEKNGRYKCFRLDINKIPPEPNRYLRFRPIEYLIKQWLMPAQPNKPQSQTSRQSVDDEYRFRISERNGDLLIIDHRWPRLMICDENGLEKYSVQIPSGLPGQLSDAVEVPTPGPARRQFVIVTLGSGASKDSHICLIAPNLVPARVNATNTDIYQSQVLARYDDVRTDYYCRLLDVDSDGRVAFVQFPIKPDDNRVQLSVRRLPDLREVASPIQLPLTPDAILSKYNDVFFDARQGDAYFAVNEKHFGVSRIHVHPPYQI